MNDTILRDQQPDADIAAVVARFEHAYAEVERAMPADAEAEDAAAASTFPAGDYEFPPEAEAALDELQLEAEAKQAQDRAAAEMRKASEAGNDSNGADVESAFAILRGGERRTVTRGEAAQQETPPATQARSPLFNTSEPQAKTLRRYAVPGAAVAVFAVILGGYLVMHPAEIRPGAGAISDAATAIAASQLRLDYDLKKSGPGPTIAQTRKR